MRFVSTALVMTAMALMLLALMLLNNNFRTLMLVGRWSALAGGDSAGRAIVQIGHVLETIAAASGNATPMLSPPRLGDHQPLRLPRG